MNFLTGKHVDRRTLLRGVGAVIALPLLDAMRPAFATPAKLGSQARRVAVVYVPNGIVMKDWKPAEPGEDFAFTRILKPLEPFRQNIVVVSGLANEAANKGKGGGLSNMFGGGVSSSLGGSAVVEKNLDRLTIICGLVWFTCIVALGLLLKQT